MDNNNALAIYGDDALNEVSDAVRQHYPDTCAIKSQQLVLQRFGVFVSEEELRDEAIRHGWYHPGSGTPMVDVGKLLELHGIGMSQYVNGNIFNVINELALGHQVIMGVDSGELWHYGLRERLEDRIPVIGGADHALIVSGINTDDPSDIKVIITDPGTGDLCKEYSLSQFVDAASDSNFYMVTTDVAVPHIFDSFGDGVDHLPMVGDMTYNYFHDHFAFLHDINSRPVFDEFVHHLDSNWDDICLGETNEAIMTGGQIDDNWVLDDIDGIDGVDDIEFIDDDIDLDFINL